MPRFQFAEPLSKHIRISCAVPLCQTNAEVTMHLAIAKSAWGPHVFLCRYHADVLVAKCQESKVTFVREKIPYES